MPYKPFALYDLKLSDARTKLLVQNLNKHPLSTPASIRALTPPTIVDSTDINTYMPIGRLIDSAEDDPIVQRSIDPSRVAKILLGDTVNGIPGILPTDDNPTPRLFDTMSVGYHEDGETISLTSGRHRLTAILTAAKLSGLDVSSPEFRAVPISVHPETYSVYGVLAANATRAIRLSERVNSTAQLLGIELSVEAIHSAFDRIGTGDKRLTVPLLYSAFFNLAVELEKREGTLNPVIASLSIETVADIGKLVVSATKSNYKAYAAGFKDGAWSREFMKLAYLALPEAVSNIRAAGVTEVARNAKLVAQAVVHILAREHFGKTIMPPTPKQRAVVPSPDANADAANADATVTPKRGRVSRAKQPTNPVP